MPQSQPKCISSRRHWSTTRRYWWQSHDESDCNEYRRKQKLTECFGIANIIKCIRHFQSSFFLLYHLPIQLKKNIITLVVVAAAAAADPCRQRTDNEQRKGEHLQVESIAHSKTTLRSTVKLTFWFARQLCLFATAAEYAVSTFTPYNSIVSIFWRMFVKLVEHYKPNST